MGSRLAYTRDWKLSPERKRGLVDEVLLEDILRLACVKVWYNL